MQRSIISLLCLTVLLSQFSGLFAQSSINDNGQLIVDGYLYYSYFDRLADPDQPLSSSQPVLWATVKKIAEKVNAIKSDLLHNTRHLTFSNQPHFYYGQWITKDYSTIVAINTSQGNSLSFVIPLPAEYSEPRPIFSAHQESGLTVDGRLLKGEIAPMDVQFYRIFPPDQADPSSGDSLSFRMAVYPNPAKNRLKLHINTGTPGKLNIRVYSLRGRSIQSETLQIYSPGAHQVNLSGYDLPAGVYFIRANMNGQTTTRKWTRLP